MLACLPILLHLDYTNTQIKRSLFMVVMGLHGKWVKQERKIRHNVKDPHTSGALFFSFFKLNSHSPIFIVHHIKMPISLLFFSLPFHLFILSLFFSTANTILLKKNIPHVFVNAYTPTLVSL